MARVKQGTDRELKAGQRAVWAQGDYPTVAGDVLAGLGPHLVAACRITEGQRVLDVAAGSGNVAIPAAEAGADVVASDLTPELLDAGREAAATRGVELEWLEADAERLPFADDEFDVVTSCIGAMFAPNHEATARELLRVCKPGGTIGLINWAPDGCVGDFFSVMAPYVPAPPPDAQPPLLWGKEPYLRELFGDRVEWLRLNRESLVIDHFRRPVDLRDYYKANFGPTIATYAGIAGDPDRVAALDSDFLDFATRRNRGPEGRTIYEFEYLLAVARKLPPTGGGGRWTRRR